MLVCFWMMMTFHHRASAEVFFCMTRLKALQLKYLSSKTEELKRLFFLFWLMIYLFLVLFLLTLAMIMIYWCHSFLVMLTINASFFVSCIFVDL